MGYKLPTFSSVTVLIGAVIFLFIVTKSSVSSFTHDESYSYLHYAHDSFMDIVSYKHWYTNNHLLNSLFMKYSEQLFGNSELALRLPNLLLLLVYMVYGHLLFKRTDSLLSIALFLLLCTNTLLIDMFGLARGYGMSCGFMLMSLYHFIESFYRQRTKNLILFHMASLLAILSQFTLLPFYAALILIYNLVILIESKIASNVKIQFLQTNKLNAIALLVVTAILYEPVRRVITYNKLDFGGKEGFYSDTIAHLINNSLHNTSMSQFTLLSMQIIFTAIVLISFILIIRMILSRNALFFDKFKGLIISNFLLVLISIGIILQHYLFGIDYPIARFSIFLFPLFIIHFGLLLNYYSSNGYRKIALSVGLGLALLSVTSFGLKANIHSSAEWHYDAETKNMIQKLEALHLTNAADPGKINLGINWLFEPTINFYRQNLDLDWLVPVHRNGLADSDDYFYVFKDDLDKLNPSDYEIVFEFERTNTLLLQNKRGQ